MHPAAQFLNKIKQMLWWRHIKLLPRYPRCEPYRGETCAEYLGGELLYAYSKHYIKDVEQQVSSTLNAIRLVSTMTPSCRKYAIRALCYHIFKTCDTKFVDSKPKLCRDDCFALYNDVCSTELHYAKSDPSGIGRLLPNCSKLPTKEQEDHKFCTPLGITRKWGIIVVKWAPCVVKYSETRCPYRYLPNMNTLQKI